jgi:hypothetical protein
VGVAEGDLALYQGVCSSLDLAVLDVVEMEELAVEPLPIGAGGSQFCLDLLVADDPALRVVSTRNMRPGWSRPFSMILWVGCRPPPPPRP